MTAKTKKCFSKCRKLPENICNEKKKMENLTRILMLRLRSQIKKISKKIYLF